MKKILAVLIATLMLLTMCSAAMAEETVTIGYLLSDLSNQFFTTLEQGIKARCEELGVEVVGYDSGNDAANDMTNMEDLINLGVDIILYNPVDSDAGEAVVELANAAGIPVVTIDRGVNGGEVVCHIASDNVYGAELAAQFIVELLGEEGGAVAEVQGMAGASAATDRHTGFDNVMSAAENITVVSSQIGNWDRTQAMTIMENVLTSNPEVKAVFCANDVMALGVVEACQANNRGDIIIVGFDADDDAIAAIQEGTMMGTIQQLPETMGVTGVDVALAYLAGEEVEPFIGVEVALVTAE